MVLTLRMNELHVVKKTMPRNYCDTLQEDKEIK